MTTGQEKWDDRIVPKSRRKAASTAETQGGKAVTVSKRATQLELFDQTADNPHGDVAEADLGRPKPATSAVPKWSTTTRSALPAMTMEAIASHDNLLLAFQQVAANKGAPGPDRQSIEAVRERLDVILASLHTELLDGSYQPGTIRRVWLPKPGGGRRGLGIPNVVARIAGQAVHQILSPHFDPTFHPSSHGFRPERSCHTAIHEARQYVEEGRNWVVDLDLEKYFDRVPHDRLLARLGQRISDRRVLDLIRRMLKSRVVMPDGVVISMEEGTPQGAPLSPLLSNVVLDELDWELARRGLRFVRYADDMNIYVQSERAGRRVMASVVKFIETRLRLKVNQEKSAVAVPAERHFVGFRLKQSSQTEKVHVLLSDRSVRRAYDKIRELTPRNWGQSLRACIDRANLYLRGWIGFFKVCTSAVQGTLFALDAHLRRRLRAILLKQWKRRRTIVRRLKSMGVPTKKAGQIYRLKRSWWAMSWLPCVNHGLKSAKLAELGLVSLKEEWNRLNPPPVIAPEQLEFAWDS